jgi:ATP-dependent Clp protease ATP-binding subunit ClpA
MTIWTEKAIRMIRKAENKAYTMNHAQLDPLHLLWAFLEGGPQAEKMAKSMELDPEMVAKAAEQELGRMPIEEGFEVSSPNDSLRRLFLRAVDLGATSPVVRQEGLIGRRELMLALTEDSGRAGALVRNFETAGDPT